MTQIERTGHTRQTGLLPTLRRTWSEFQEDRLTDQAAALTYYGVLSLFPALIALVSLVGIRNPGRDDGAAPGGPEQPSSSATS